MKNFTIFLFAFLLCFTLGAQSTTNLGVDSGSNGNHNTLIGYKSGENITSTGNLNTFLGSYAGNANNYGDYNTFIGVNAGKFNTSGYNNTFLGGSTGRDNTTGKLNTFLGRNAGMNNETGQNNIFLGVYTGINNKTGSNNTFLGTDAGHYSTGSGNVSIGYKAGYYETGSNKLHINNTYSGLSLVYGDFSTDELTINGTFEVNDVASNTNEKVAHFQDSDERRLFFVPKVGNAGYNYLSETNDVGIFWSDAVAAGDKNQSAALVIAPHAYSDAGIRLTADGKAQIGDVSTASNDYKLFVEKGILTEEILVESTNDWPDYVFENDYKIKTLKEVESFIKTNGHLPNTPNAKDIAENGLRLKETTFNQQEKIEELFLYIIEMNKKVKELEDKLNNQDVTKSTKGE